MYLCQGQDKHDGREQPAGSAGGNDVLFLVFTKIVMALPVFSYLTSEMGINLRGEDAQMALYPEADER